MSNIDKLNEFLSKDNDEAEVFEFYDTLDPVDVDFMIGVWEGKEVHAHHPMDGFLTAIHWYGKWFKDKDHVHPIIIEKSDGTLYAGNPANMPINETAAKMPRDVIEKLTPMFKKLFSTHDTKAVIRETEYRGKTGAAMIYDERPIIDVFRKIDEDTLLGAINYKDMFDGQVQFFMLKRAPEGTVVKAEEEIE